MKLLHYLVFPEKPMSKFSSKQLQLHSPLIDCQGRIAKTTQKISPAMLSPIVILRTLASGMAIHTSLISKVCLISMFALLSACQTNAPAQPTPISSATLSDLLATELILTRGELATASKQYSASAEKLQNNDLAARATYAAQQTNPDAYLQASQIWVNISPTNPEAYQHLAQALYKQGRAQKAETILLQVIKEHKSYLPSPIFLADVYLKTNQHHKADQILKYHTQQKSINPQIGRLHALALSAQKKYPEAIHLLKKLEAQYPANSEWSLLLASIYLDSGDFERAEQTLLNRLERYPNDSQLQFRAGTFYQQHNQISKALKHYGQVISEPYLTDSIEAQLSLSQISIDNIESLFSQWRKQYQASPEIVSHLYYRQGNYHIELKQPKKALAVFQQGLDAYPSDTDLLYHLVVLQSHMNNWQAMEMHLQRLLLVDPNHAHGLNALGYYYVNNNQNMALAEQYITKAIALEPNNPAIIDSAGWLAYKLGDLSKAHNLLMRAWERLPDAEITAHLGGVEWALGNTEKAFILWNQVLIKDPHNETVKRVIDEVQARYPLQN